MKHLVRVVRRRERRVQCDEELDFVAVGIVHVHPFGGGVVQLEQDHDAGSFEFALDGIELVERVTDLERDVREAGGVPIG